ncbi:hypothetical protein PMIT1342_00940 [Prochlorococcus marinus str. MIT 1342]|uniref:hypothetical protein n=1 Tax=Prochlorococcus TaxID=1218 RepID=UPI0007BB2254|nr:hypothetical protein [Prochlorococcus marinus]KZR82470.1 hypothetical protein PMIT1342_00940 [Prochlorococcus marinus str. MIT 1342]
MQDWLEMMIVGYLQQANLCSTSSAIQEHNSIRLLHNTHATLIEMFSKGLLIVWLLFDWLWDYSLD